MESSALSLPPQLSLMGKFLDSLVGFCSKWNYFTEYSVNTKIMSTDKLKICYIAVLFQNFISDRRQCSPTGSVGRASTYRPGDCWFDVQSGYN